MFWLLGYWFGPVIGENQIKKLCGRNQNFQPMYFQENQVWFSFNSADAVSFRGFSAVISTPFQLIYTNLKLN
jgi:hypothetical protein